MLLPAHDHRSLGMTAGERRLIFQQAGPSALQTEVMDFLQRDVTDEEVNDISEKIKMEDKAVLERARQSLNNLMPRESVLVQKNIARIEERIGVHVETTDKLREIQEKQELEEVETTSPDRKSAETIAAATKPEIEVQKPARTLVGTLGDTAESVAVGVLPKAWTDNMSRERRIATGAVMTVGVGILGAMLLSKLMEGGKKAGGWLKNIVVGTGIGLAFVGVLKGVGLYRDYKQGMETVKATKEKLMQEIETTKQQARALRMRAAREAGKAKEQLEAQARKLEEKTNTLNQKIEDIKNGERPAEDETDRTEKEDATPEISEDADIPAESVHPEVDQAIEAARSKAIIMTTAGLLMTNSALAEQAGIRRGNKNETDKVADMLERADVREITVEQALGITTPEEADALLPGLTKAQKHALFFLMLVTQNAWRNEIVRKTIAGNGAEPDPKTTSIGDMLDVTTMIPNVFGNIGSALEGKSLDAIGDVRAVLTTAFSAESTMHQMVDHPVIRTQLIALEPALKGKEAQFAFFCLVQKNRLTLKDVINLKPRNADEAIFLRALSKIRQELLTPEAQKHLQLYAHKDPRFGDILGTHLSGDLNVQDAAQLYAYLQLGKDPSKGGVLSETLRESKGSEVFLLQMKVLDIVSKVDKEEGIRMRDTLLLRGNASLDLPDEVQGMLKKLVEVGGTQASNILLSWAKVAWTEGKTFVQTAHKEQPVIAGVVDTALAGAAAYTGHRWWNINWTEMMAHRLVSDTKGKFKIPFWLRFTKAGQQAGNLSNTVTLGVNIRNIEKTINGISDTKYKNMMLKSFEHLHRRGYLPSSFQTFYDDVADILSRMPPTGPDQTLINTVKGEVSILQGDAAALQIRRFGFLRRQWKSGVEVTKKGYEVIANSKFAKEAARLTGVGVQECIRMLAALNMPSWMVNAFAKSQSAMNMLFNAARSGIPGLQYLMKLGAYTKAAGKVAGGAAVGIDVVICAVEMAANKVRIAETDNADIKELYAMRDKISVANAAAGTAFSGALLASSWAPAAAPVAVWLALPLAGVIATKHAHDQLESVSATWLSTDKEWAKKSAGGILNGIDALGPGQVSFWQNLATGNSRLETFHKWDTLSKEEFEAWQAQAIALPETANQWQRFQAMRAYVANMTEIEPTEGESEEAFRKRFADSQKHQIDYIADVTEGKFGNGILQTYRNAAGHGDLMMLSQTLQNAHESQMITIMKRDENGREIEKEFDLARYAEFKNQKDRTADGITPLDVIIAFRKQQQTVTMIQLDTLKQMGGSANETSAMQDELMQHTLLMEVRHDITLCEKNILNADFNGWELTGGEEKTRGLARYAMNVELRKLLRAESDRLQQTASATPADLEKSVNRIRAFLQQDALQFEAITKNGNYGGAGEFADTPDVLTDYRWIRENLYLRPRPATPLSQAA